MSHPSLPFLSSDETLIIMRQTYPSELTDMSYRMPFSINNRYSIHMGFRNGDLIVRACDFKMKKMYEIIPQEVFIGRSEVFDLPAPLIENCVHWLDIETGELEARQQPNIWIQKPSNWV